MLGPYAQSPHKGFAFSQVKSVAMLMLHEIKHYRPSYAADIVKEAYIKQRKPHHWHL